MARLQVQQGAPDIGIANAASAVDSVAGGPDEERGDASCFTDDPAAKVLTNRLRTEGSLKKLYSPSRSGADRNTLALAMPWRLWRPRRPRNRIA
jgi:hypothetical protein